MILDVALVWPGARADGRHVPCARDCREQHGCARVGVIVLHHLHVVEESLSLVWMTTRLHANGKRSIRLGPCAVNHAACVGHNNS